MASIVLSAAGTVLSSALPAPFGQIASAVLRSGLITSGQGTSFRGPRLADLAVQTSTYGKMIPIVYGTMRLGGNIIWSRPINETSTTSSSGGKGGGSTAPSTTTFSYSVTLAVAICEGPVDSVLRVWADAKQLDLSQYTIRIYKGDETQTPDSLIQSFEGTNNTPAYRGLAYAVFENFPLGDYGNRIPNFTFEVQKKTPYADYNGEVLEDMIKGMVMIPGAGEYVYDTQVEYKIPGAQVGSEWAQQGDQQAINMHNAYGKANALLALDQMQATCPNVTWVSVVVGWFGDDMDAGACVVKPGVEFQAGATTAPDIWQAGSFTRSTARQITLVSGLPQYGGTPDDDSIVRYLTELRNRGFKILFYPLMFMDVSGKPWRGDLTGSATDVSNFFTKMNGYNAFITHYANLVNGKVDAFSIGSELKGLTKVTSTPGAYPAVTQLVSLAATVKGILGGSVKVTYAADWSEYHHTDGGWYHLDPLWASSNIDVVGIDAYFPLTDAPQDNTYNIDAIKTGWTSGEGYDWYYSDPARTIQTPLTPQFAWKNIDWFWNNTHTNPDSSTTAWTPQMKKIWFTEYGFPSVDGATNQPNVFYDPTSSASAFPYYSKGRVDFRAQRASLTATEQQWKNSTMIERMFVWTWDARPFPYWPDLTHVWSDGIGWKTGHWVQGKLGISSLSGIISDLCERTGLTSGDIGLNGITDQVEGFIIASQQTVRQAIESLQQGYFFDAVESDNTLKLISRGKNSVLSISEDDLIPTKHENGDDLFQITRIQEIELPKRFSVVYLDRLLNYQSSTQYSQREATLSQDAETLDLPIVFSDQSAKNIADISLFSRWIARASYQFSLPLKYSQLEPTDVITVTVAGVAHRMRIVSTHRQAAGLIRVQAVAEDTSVYDFYTLPGQGTPLLQQNVNIPVTRLELLDIPAFPGDDNDKAPLRMAAAGLTSGWTGSAIYRSDDGGASYNRINDIMTPGAIGNASTTLAPGPTEVFDNVNAVTIIMVSGELQNAAELAVLNGANAAMLGSEVIQFKTATLIEPGKYTLSGLLRGRLGTEWAIGAHTAGERFVLLGGAVSKQILTTNVIGQLRNYKAVTFNSALSVTAAQNFTYTGIALKPYSPVHVQAIRDGSGNLTLIWIRRTRLGGEWQDGIDAPLNEFSEDYEVEIMNGGNIARTITGITSPAASYSAAQQTTDFGSPQSSVSVKVYQLSNIVGRGYPAAASV